MGAVSRREPVAGARAGAAGAAAAGGVDARAEGRRPVGRRRRPAAWLAEASRLAPLIPGITTFDVSDAEEAAARAAIDRTRAAVAALRRRARRRWRRDSRTCFAQLRRPRRRHGARPPRCGNAGFASR